MFQFHVLNNNSQLKICSYKSTFQKAWDSLQWNLQKNCVSDHRGEFTSTQNDCETWKIKPIKHEYDPGSPLTLNIDEWAMTCPINLPQADPKG